MQVKRTLDINTRNLVNEVIEANLDYLVRFAMLRVGNRYDAEDIVHEAVTRLLETDVTKIRKESLRMYLFKIVYNLCRDSLTSGNHFRELSEDDDNIPDYGYDETLDADLDELARLTGLLADLPEREAEVVRMNAMDGLSFVEISHILSIPASTAKSRYKSGMEKLKRQYFKKQ